MGHGELFICDFGPTAHYGNFMPIAYRSHIIDVKTSRCVAAWRALCIYHGLCNKKNADSVAAYGGIADGNSYSILRPDRLFRFNCATYNPYVASLSKSHEDFAGQCDNWGSGFYALCISYGDTGGLGCTSYQCCDATTWRAGNFISNVELKTAFILMQTTAALQTEHLSVGYKGVPLLSDLNLELYPGQTVALVGRNGVGKSTLLRTLTREQQPIAGRILIQGVPIEKLSRKELAKKIAVVTTDRDIADGLLAREIVYMGRHPHTDLLTRYSELDHQIVKEAMELTGIALKSARRFDELSDGERQKVMITRALVQQTPVIILDEPFSFLDTAARVEILSLLKRLAENSGTAILFSSHDVAQALRMADYMWLLTPDRKLLTGIPDQLKENGDIERLFDEADIHFDPIQNDFVKK